MKPRLIIHIGTDKTGTTYLQKTFSHNYENLLGQKILYLQNFSLDLLNYGTQERGGVADRSLLLIRRGYIRVMG